MQLLSMNMIESVTPTDFPALAALWESSVRATHTFLGEEDIHFFRPRILNDYLPALNVWVIRANDREIKGFIGLSDDTIEMLFVAPHWSGSGVGSELVTFVLTHFPITKVDVNEQNERARKFYEKMGFIAKHRSAQDSYGKPFPIIHMEQQTFS
ncbi:GNAT family N-acetyltransferase [Pectobacterium parmentieri]|uniref:GNAT family N-acetyltransferase n=2 Tax=Pectobacterium parmentieri TaxID=1905730 RepID=A0A8B3FUH7_PECPM|nr:GNAT family N-acetyltransferase [Pectobacterium parmentieri]PWD66650.1 GNAT family N-acetyltransferase [Pectobacterium parmentieri]RKO76233.1 GNAT family N-acetyltransferase [Pectobacterium parmentieri]